MKKTRATCMDCPHSGRPLGGGSFECAVWGNQIANHERCSVEDREDPVEAYDRRIDTPERKLRRQPTPEEYAERLGTRECAICGAEFPVRHPHAKYCSAECAAQAYREQSRASALRSYEAKKARRAAV